MIFNIYYNEITKLTLQETFALQPGPSVLSYSSQPGPSVLSYTSPCKLMQGCLASNFF